MVGGIYCGMFLVTVAYLLYSYLVFEGMRKVMDSVFYPISFFLYQINHRFGEHVVCVCVRVCSRVRAHALLINGALAEYLEIGSWFKEFDSWEADGQWIPLPSSRQFSSLFREADLVGLSLVGDTHWYAGQRLGWVWVQVLCSCNNSFSVLLSSHPPELWEHQGLCCSSGPDGNGSRPSANSCRPRAGCSVGVPENRRRSLLWVVLWVDYCW